jgi:hypothetical protein
MPLFISSPAGTYSNGTGLTFYAGNCTASTYCPLGGVAPIVCPERAYCPVASSGNYTVCDAGRFCNATGLTAPAGNCSAGYYCPPGSLVATERVCDRGYFCPPAVGAQIFCLDGMFCNATGMSAGIPCGPPSHCPTGSANQTVCPERAYCPIGKYIMCDAGAFCNATGLTAPAGNCSAGYFCPPGSRVATERACDRGHYCPPAVGEQIASPAGAFCATTGLSVFANCTPGKYCNTTGLSAPQGNWYVATFCVGVTCISVCLLF